MQLEDFLSKLVQAANKNEWDWHESHVKNFLTREGLSEVDTGIDSRIDYVSKSESTDISLYLSESKVEWLEITLEFIEDPDTFSVENYNLNISNLGTKFQEILTNLEKRLGTADVYTDCCSSEIIDFYCAIHIAIWNFSSLVIIFKLEHQDPDVPLILDLRIAEAVLP
jgi:hypothetical protein